jgi:cytochrome b
MSKSVVVWDPLVRSLHWSLATSVIVAFFTHERSVLIHEISGYLALAFVVIRIFWGFLGPEHARFSNFIASPWATWGYTRAVLKRDEPHYVGHNPLGGWMILALFVAVAGASGSGWLFETDTFWGDETVEAIHLYFGYLFVPLVVLHVSGVIFTSIRQRENLVAAMIHGHKTLDG